MTTAPDLLAELAEIQRLAKRAQKQIATGEAKTGVTALRRIEERADDARRHIERAKT